MGYLLWAMRDLANSIKRMQANKFDAVIVFDGKRGLGKSTGAVKLALGFPQFKMKKDIVFSRDDVMNSLAKKKQGIIIADEMINVTYNRDFYSEQQKKLLKMLNMYRDSCNVLIACVPNFYDLDKQFRALVKLRINVVRRGLAIIHSQNKSSYSSDPWDLSVNEKIERAWLKKGIVKPNYSRLTTFRGILRYGDLGKKQRELYEKIKQDKRGKVVEVEEEQPQSQIDNYQRFTDFLLNRYKAGQPLTKDQVLGICEASGKSAKSMLNTVNRILEQRGLQERTGDLLLSSSSKTPLQNNKSYEDNNTKIYKIPRIPSNDD